MVYSIKIYISRLSILLYLLRMWLHLFQLLSFFFVLFFISAPLAWSDIKEPTKYC